MLLKDRLSQMRRMALLWSPLIAMLGILWLSAPTWHWDRQSTQEIVPTMDILAVRQDRWVIIRVQDFPAGTELQATMGAMWTRGVGGQQVGSIVMTDQPFGYYFFEIPEELRGQNRISIRLQSPHAHPYFAFNWFYNQDST